MPISANTEATMPYIIPEGKRHLILCEGIEDEWFLKCYLDSYAFSDYDMSEIEVKQFRGINNIRNEMRVLPNVPGFSELRSILVVRDADDDIESAQDSVKDAFRLINLPIPQSEHEWFFKNTIKTGFLLMPSCSDKSQPGALEDLCWKIMTNKHGESIHKEVVGFIESLRQSGKRIYTHLNKAYIHTYFSATEGLISFNIGRAARAGAFDWSSPELDPLHSFLVSMVNTDS